MLTDRELARMSAPDLKRALAKAEKASSKMNDRMIAAGRGREKFSETYRRDDPLSLEFRAINDHEIALRGELQYRMRYHGTAQPVKSSARYRDDEPPKGNPIMATAKQIAARKEFARIMKSGGFGAARKRKSAAPKRRKANPVARHPGGGIRSGSGFFAPQMTPEAVRGMAGAKRRRKNPVSGGGRMTHPRMSEKQAMNDPGGYRDMNPARRRAAPGYRVEGAVKSGGAWRCIATFGKLPEAKSYALALGRSNPSRAFRVMKP